jgi:glutaredoxin
VYGSWIVLLIGMAFYLFRGSVVQAVVWVFFVGLFLWLYVKYFPSLAKFMGYGSVADKPATTLQSSKARVILYTGVGCPFCPIVEKRLTELQKKMGFELSEIDVTLKPDILIKKGIRALPVIEVTEALRVGNGTSEEIADFILAHSAAHQAS